jgi:hypothetical protein
MAKKSEYWKIKNPIKYTKSRHPPKRVGQVWWDEKWKVWRTGTKEKHPFVL